MEHPVRIVVVLMIRNEAKIIARCIESVMCIADAISIMDTGSTDDTIDVLKEFLPPLKIPAQISGSEWKDFGHNRSTSYVATDEFVTKLGWDKNKTYALVIDADMRLIVMPTFKKQDLTAVGYSLIQKTEALEYYNIRLLRMDFQWRCIGVTHEFWAGDNRAQLPQDMIYIEDINDGGCKHDKYERDQALLERGLKEEPDNVRYMFYLAQTYKDMKQFAKAIDMYKCRVKAGGWEEEVWYSMYQITRLHYELGDMNKMEYWGNKSHKFRPSRTEVLYFMAYTLMEKGQVHKAWHYAMKGIDKPKPADVLFVETHCYTHLFKYLRAVLAQHVTAIPKSQSLRNLIEYYNTWGGGGDETYHVMEKYVEVVSMPGYTTRPLPFLQIGDFIPSSVTLVRASELTEPKPDAAVYLLGVRYVNYRIQPNGSYLMSANGQLRHDNPVRTETYAVWTDADFTPLTPLRKMQPGFAVVHHGNKHIEALEDVRLYCDGGAVRWVGTSAQYSHNGSISMSGGRFDVATSTLTDHVSYIPPVPTGCEKNWIPLENSEFVYGWAPFRIGKVDECGQMVIMSSQDTPRLFGHVRGSSNFVTHGDAQYAIVHVVMYTAPRKYYHSLVKMQNRRLVGITMPFFFKNNSIEYVLGMDITADGKVKILFSQMDSNPEVAVMPTLEAFVFEDLASSSSL